MTDEQRVAVVSGGSGAIGSAVVAALQNSGHRTVVLSRTGDITCDLGSESSTKQAAAAVLERYGRCDVFVHCAGRYDAMCLSEFDLQRWRDHMMVNVESSLLLLQEFTKGMVDRGFGRIVFVSSDGVWSPPNAEFLPYTAGKAALLGVMRTLAVTFGANGISVSAVAPGLTDTPFSHPVAGEDAMRAVVEKQAMKRPLTPADTANTVAFLASDGAQALTGQVLVVDGGIHLR
jgi:NAD(P)-dependent dehydrogenase (short-subunit alcohol dehydrogenase family)